MIGGLRLLSDGSIRSFAALPRAGTRRPPRQAAPRAETAEHGYVYCGPTGAGHFVKMIHNGIEYGLMQAYAEGFDILRSANQPTCPKTTATSSIWPISPRSGAVAAWSLRGCST